MNKRISSAAASRNRKITPEVSNVSPILPSKDIIVSLKLLKEKYIRAHKSQNVLKFDGQLMKSFDLVNSHKVDKSILQGLSSERLSKGRSAKDIRIPLYEKIPSEAKAKVLIESIKAEEDEEIIRFAESFIILKSLKSAVEMNYNICMKEKAYKDIYLNGMQFVLKDKIKEFSENKKVNIEQLSNELLQLNEPIKELIRAFKAKEFQQAAEMLDLFWRVLLKLIDNACLTSDYNTKILFDNIQSSSRGMYTEKSNEISLLKQQFSATIEKITGENLKLKEKVKKIQQESDRMREKLNTKTEYIKDITRIDDRKKSLSNLKHLLKGLDNFITDSETEHNKQVIMLQNVANLIENVEVESRRPPAMSKGVQTDFCGIEGFDEDSRYEEYVKLFGNSYGEIGSNESINAFVALIKRNLEAKNERRHGLKRRTKN